MSNKVVAVSCDAEYSNLYDMMGGDILSMGFVEILEDFTLGREICEYSKATNPIYFNEESRKVHGFSYWKALEFQPRIESIKKINSWLEEIDGELPLEFVYHGNAKSDFKWIEAHWMKEDQQDAIYKFFSESKVESTLQMAREKLKHIEKSQRYDPIKKKKYGTYTLRNIADHYGLKFDEHDALSDARVCAQIYCNMKKDINTWTGRLL